SDQRDPRLRGPGSGREALRGRDSRSALDPTRREVHDMTKDLYNKLACPYDKAAPLTLTVFRIAGEEIVQGLLECPTCERYFPIIGKVPVLLPDEYRDPKLEMPFLLQWREAIGERLNRGRGFRLPPREAAAAEKDASSF